MTIRAPASAGSAADERRQVALRRIHARRKFKISLVIFVSVNAVLLATWAALALADVHTHSQLWPYPIAMGLWAAYVAFQGYSAYRGKRYTEEQIQRELNKMA
jgi:hypothetical protein